MWSSRITVPHETSTTGPHEKSKFSLIVVTVKHLTHGQRAFISIMSQSMMPNSFLVWPANSLQKLQLVQDSTSSRATEGMLCKNYRKFSTNITLIASLQITSSLLSVRILDCSIIRDIYYIYRHFYYACKL